MTNKPDTPPATPDPTEPVEHLMTVLDQGESWRIAEAVHQAELSTSGEIIVKLSAATADGNLRQIAEAEYIRLGLASHPHQHGVLIYVSLNRRGVEIVVGPEAVQQLPADLWKKCAAEIAAGFRNNTAADGIISAVNMMATPLAQKFPPGDVPGPELPNVSEGP